MFAMLSSCPIIVAPGIHAALVFSNQGAYSSDCAEMPRRIRSFFKIDMRRNARHPKGTSFGACLLRPTALATRPAPLRPTLRGPSFGRIAHFDLPDALDRKHESSGFVC